MLPLLALLAAVAAPQAETAAPPKLKPLPPGVVQVQLDTLHCPSCAKAIARNLYKTPGVMRVKTDMKKDQVWITVQPKKQIDLARVWQACKLKDAAPVGLRIGAKQFKAEHLEPKQDPQVAAGKPASQR